MDTTRISDLPDIPISGPPQQHNIQLTMNPEMDNTGYMQMNVHPNPYGTDQQPPLPPPQQTQAPQKLNNQSFMFPNEQGPQYPNQQQQYGGQPPQYASQQQQQQQYGNQQPQYSLPSRDIPMTTEHLMHDDHIRPNYIPHTQSQRDYIPEEEEEEDTSTSGDNRPVKKSKDKRVRFADDVFVSIQRPIIIALLYFLFEVPIFNSFINKYLYFLKMYGVDGNINTRGITFKSILFGLFIYGIEYFM